MHIAICVFQTTAKNRAIWINSIQAVQSSEIYLESWIRLLRKGEPEVYLSFSNQRLFRRTVVDKRIRLGSIDPPLHPFSVKKQKNSSSQGGGQGLVDISERLVALKFSTTT